MYVNCNVNCFKESYTSSNIEQSMVDAKLPRTLGPAFET